MIGERPSPQRESPATDEMIELSPEQREELNLAIESVLSKNFLNKPEIDPKAVEVSVAQAGPTKATGVIGYEFEIEKETRYVIQPENPDATTREKKWTDHVIDTYDESGRARIRIKNGQPRLSLKVPLYSRDTKNCKACIRLEFKPVTEQQKNDLLTIKDLILEEKGTQTSEKWGTQISTGEKKILDESRHKKQLVD